MVAASAMSIRGTTIARTFASAFEALKEHAKQFPAEAAELAQHLGAHLRSAWPMAQLVDTGPVVRVDPPADTTEIDRLGAENDHMRPVYVAALRWRDGETDGRELCEAINAAVPKEGM